MGSCVDQHAAPAIQQAIDGAASKNAIAVYLLGGNRGDPNWYLLKKSVWVHGSALAVFDGREYRQASHEWQMWSLLRASAKPTP